MGGPTAHALAHVHRLGGRSVVRTRWSPGGRRSQPARTPDQGGFFNPASNSPGSPRADFAAPVPTNEPAVVAPASKWNFARAGGLAQDNPPEHRPRRRTYQPAFPRTQSAPPPSSDPARHQRIDESVQPFPGEVFV